MGFLEMLHIRHEMKIKIKISFTHRRLNVQQIIKTYACLTGGSPYICIDKCIREQVNLGYYHMTHHSNDMQTRRKVRERGSGGGVGERLLRSVVQLFNSFT